MASKEIDLLAYVTIIKKRFWLIVTFVTVCTFAAAVYSSYNYVPMYSAATKLVVNQTVQLDQLGKEQMDFGAIGVNIGLINTYKEIIKTPAIMDKVIQRHPELNLTADQLISMVNVSALNDTQVMAITATDVSHQRAVLIVNAVSQVFQAEISKILKVDNVAILTEAKMKEHPQPINKKQNTYIILGFMGSFIAAIGIVLLLDALDDTIKTEDDIQQILGISTLSMISKMKKQDVRKPKKTSLKQIGERAYASIEQ